jgi:hypothetical protein
LTVFRNWEMRRIFALIESILELGADVNICIESIWELGAEENIYTD